MVIHEVNLSEAGEQWTCSAERVLFLHFGRAQLARLAQALPASPERDGYCRCHRLRSCALVFLPPLSLGGEMRGSPEWYIAEQHRPYHYHQARMMCSTVQCCGDDDD